MSKKKKNTTDGPASLVLVMLVILYFIAKYILMFIPVAIALVIVYYWINWKILKSKYPNKNISDFWLDENETRRFEQLDSKLRIASRNVEFALEQADAEGIIKNKDGSFSKRSKRGKEINAELYENQSYIDSNFDEYDDLQEAPYSKWFALRKVFININSFFGVFLLWIASFIYLFKKDVSNSFFKVIDIVKYYFGDLTDIPELKDDWETSFILVLVYSSLISIVGYLIGRIIGAIRYGNSYEMPPMVNNENLNSY